MLALPNNSLSIATGILNAIKAREAAEELDQEIAFYHEHGEAHPSELENSATLAAQEAE